MSRRPFVGARVEETLMRNVNRVLVDRQQWRHVVLPYTGYGTEEHVRVLARVVVRPGEAQTQIGQAAEAFLGQRGWRNFVSTPVPRADVSVSMGGSTLEVRTDRNGYVDVSLAIRGLEPGVHHAEITTRDGVVCQVPVHVYSSQERFGIVSDIDDTVISTMLPRLLIAAWNSFVVTEEGRRPVPGMAEMYARLLEQHPGAPVVYVSTGAWNTYPFLRRFLERHGFPDGAMLLTDWGPTNTGWFRSGPEHKRTSLRELARDFPHVRWLLVGDDGQHDPGLYHEFANLQPDKVRAIALRELSVGEQILAHGSSTVLADHDEVVWRPTTAPEVRGPDGEALLSLVEQALHEPAPTGQD